MIYTPQAITRALRTRSVNFVTGSPSSSWDMSQSSPPVASDLQKLATGSALAFGGAVIGNGLTYLFGLSMGRLLGAESVGFFFLALILMQLAGSVCRVGLPDGLLRFVSIRAGEGNLSTVKGTILFSSFVAISVSLLVAMILFLVAEPVANHVFQQPGFVSYVRWMAVTLPFFAVLVVLLNATQALKRMELVVVSRDFIQPITMLAAGMILFYFIGGATSFLAAHLGSMIIAFLTSIYFLLRVCPAMVSSTAAFDDWKALLAFSLPVAGGDVVNYLFRWSDTLLLSFLRSASEVGIYNAAVRTTLLLSLLAVAINALYGPIIADHYHNGRYQRIEVILKTLMRWCLTLALPIVFAMCLLGDQILSLWGSNFGSGSTALIILALSQLFFITSGLLAFTLLMCGRQYLEVGNVVFVTALNIVSNLVLIPRYGITGAALAMFSSQAVVLMVRLIEVRHVLRLRLYTSSYLKPALALLPASILGIMLQASFTKIGSVFLQSNLVAIFITSVAISIGYFTVLYFLGFEEEDLTVWKQFRTS
jgi:O-antigen/teichoic acid export membrane protein